MPITDSNVKELPSPEQLKRKILLKDKTLAPSGKVLPYGLLHREIEISYHHILAKTRHELVEHQKKQARYPKNYRTSSICGPHDILDGK